MPNLNVILSIAQLEAKLLFRSWAFRIFSLIGLFFLTLMDIGLGTPVGGAPHSFRALAGALPMMNIKLLNVYQGIIIVFLATEFIKRDRNHDTTQVLLTRSFANTDYYLGKVMGILTVFVALNFITLLIPAVIHMFFSYAPFTPAAYFWYIALVSVPTLTFMLGVALLAITWLRSQALVFVLLLGLSLVSLIFVGHKYDFILDIYAFHQPLMYSDFNGLVNLSDLLAVRGTYFLIGLAAIALAPLLMNRLRQSRPMSILAAAVAVLALSGGIFATMDYKQGKNNQRAFRVQMRELNQAVAGLPVPSMTRCAIDLHPEADSLRGTAKISLENFTSDKLDSLLVTLNPGLKVTNLTSTSTDISWNQNQHLYWIKPSQPMAPGEVIDLELNYHGRINNLYAFPDIDDDRFFGVNWVFMYSLPKEYATLSDEAVHLTPEVGWYPRAGLSPGAAYPSGGKKDFTSFELTVTLPSNLTAVSQGKPVKNETDRLTSWHFSPPGNLPQISITAAPYEVRSIKVDSVTFALYSLPGHDYYAEYFDEIADTLPLLIRELTNEYEVGLGLSYPYSWFSLVEAPIGFYSYKRYWTMAHETVQPGLIYLSEMASYNGGADFHRMKRGAKRRQERANQADSPVAIQTAYFLAFARTVLLGNERNLRAERQIKGIETSCLILPNYVSHQTFVESSRWPILNYAFESYFAALVNVGQSTRGRRWRGLMPIEKGNLALQKMPLDELLEHPDIEREIKDASLGIKGRFLLAMIDSRLDQEHQSTWLNDFLKSHRGTTVADTTLIRYAAALGSPGVDQLLDSWLHQTDLPGFWLEDVESYKVRDGDRVRSQLKFKISNPTEVDGLVQIGLRLRKQEANFDSWWSRNQSQYDLTQMLDMPAGSAREVGMMTDQPVHWLSIETYASQNLPSVISLPFRDQKVRDNESPWEGVRSVEVSARFADEGEFLVDNEDEGFVVISEPQENWLRKNLLALFGEEEDSERYVGMHFWNPPGRWLATTHQDFFGTFVHSAYYKKSGDGNNNVAWYADLDSTTYYDIYYFCSETVSFGWGRHGRNKNVDKGKRNFLVYHENGIDELPLDLNGTEEGWNLLGTYRLEAGTNRVEMTDVNSQDMVTADAVKWVKH